MYRFTKENAIEARFGSGSTYGSCNAVLNNLTHRSAYSVYTTGTISINFSWLNENEDVEKFRDQFAVQLKDIGFDIPDGYKNDWLNFEAEEWIPKLEAFKKDIKEMLI